MKKRYNKVGTTRTLFIIICLAWPLLQWAVFYLGININSILMAFQRSIPGSPDKFWTLENFRRIFIEGFIGEEPLLLQATKNTIVFFLFNFLILSPLNIFVGYFFYKKIPGTKVFRFIFYLPAIIPGTVMATLFKYIISPESSGVLATIFGAMGVRFPNLLGSSEYAMKTMLVYNAWIGFTGFLITVNSMRRIPTEIIESAQLDGITPLKEVVFILVRKQCQAHPLYSLRSCHPRFPCGKSSSSYGRSRKEALSLWDMCAWSPHGASLPSFRVW